MRAILRALGMLVLAAAFFFGIGSTTASAQSDTNAPTVPAANPIVNVAHFAPFAGALNDTSVTVRVNGADVLTDFVYSEIVTGISLPAGVYTAEVLPTGSVTVAMSGVFTLENNKNYSLLAIGDGSTEEPLALTAIVDDGIAPAAGKAKILLGHYAPFTSTVAATKVDICNDATGTPVPGLTDIPYGVNTGFLQLDAGIYDLSIAVANTGCATVALDLPALALVAGKTYDAYAIGKINTVYPLQVTTIRGLDFPAMVDVGHFAPFSTTVAGTKVDIYLNGSEAITDVVYGGKIPDVRLLPGNYLVEVKPDNTSTVAISATATLTSGGSYALAAIGDGSNQPLKLAVLENNGQTNPAKARVRVSHFAPFASGTTATAVDICIDATKTVLIPNLVFGATTPYLEIAPGIYDLSVAVPGTSCAQVVLDLPPLQFNAGGIYEIYAIGKGNTVYPLALDSFGALDFPATVTVGHFAPFGSTVAGTKVDIRVNGQTALTDVVFGEYFPNLLLPSGPLFVEVVVPSVAASAANTVAISGTFTLTGQTKYDLFAIGDGANQPLGFSATVITPTAPAGQALLTVGHLAPFAPDVNATAVDICTDAGTVLIANLKYPEVRANLILLPGLYKLKIALPGTNCGMVALDLPQFRLVAGDVRDAFAIGKSLTPGSAFPVQLATTTGLSTYEQFLPRISKPATVQ